MVKSYNIFEGSQMDINRRLLRKIEALENTSSTAYDDSEIKADIASIKEDIGADNKANTVKGRIKALEDAS